MLKKILLAIENDFTRKVYSRVSREEGFEVFETNNGREALILAKEKIPDIILADVSLPEVGGFDLIKILRAENVTKRIPVMIFSNVGKEEDRNRALELEAKDFIVGIFTTPLDIVLRTKFHLGEQKTYRLKVSIRDEKIKELAKDLNYPGLICHRCGSELILFLMRDLSKGKNYFKVSFICPNCD